MLTLSFFKPLAWSAAVLLAAPSVAFAQTIVRCQWENGGEDTYRILESRWDYFDKGTWGWKPLPCDADTHRMSQQPVCTVETTDSHYSRRADVQHVQPGVWVKDGFDLIVIDRNSGVGNYVEWGGTSYYDPALRDSIRDSRLVGQCGPVADPAASERPGPRF